MNTKNSMMHPWKNDFLKSLFIMGWDSHFQEHLDKKSSNRWLPARIVGVHKNSFLLGHGNKEVPATVSGRLHYKRNNLFPVIGDWVLMKDNIIFEVLPRKNALSRGASGAHKKQGVDQNKEQVIAANLDTVFIVCGLDRDFNIRRLERYLTLVYNCGLNPVIILTKADLHTDLSFYVNKVEAVTFGVSLCIVSAMDSVCLKPLESYLSQGKTIAMVGSSGAGKSTIINRLYGKTIQVTNSISKSVGKGKHTTTSRSLIMMPQGGMVIDNPGIREIGLWDDGGGLDVAFPEIETLAGSCRFHDCNHTHEPDCKVLKGLADGIIRQDRLDSYQKMKRELAYLSMRQKKSADRVEKERWKEIALKLKAMKSRKKDPL